MQKIWCLMTGGGTLSEETRTTLFETAQEMIYSKKTQFRLREGRHGVDGNVLTENKFGSMGSVYGIVFCAEVEDNGCLVKVSFIVRPMGNQRRDIDARWARRPLFPIEEEPAHN